MYVNDFSMLTTPAFADRADAGRALGDELVAQALRPGIVLGLTRGGVPVAAEVARLLKATLDIIVVKKIGAPFSLELAIGAICSDGTRVLHREYIRELEISDDYVERMSKKMLEEAQSAESRYRGGGPAPELRGRTVLVVDDGVATGSTMEAAVPSVRNRGAAQVTVAVPVASPESVSRLASVADRIFALRQPAAFFAVGQFYRYFGQVQDEEVTRLMTAGKEAYAA